MIDSLVIDQHPSGRVQLVQVHEGGAMTVILCSFHPERMASGVLTLEGLRFGWCVRWQKAGPLPPARGELWSLDDPWPAIDAAAVERVGERLHATLRAADATPRFRQLVVINALVTDLCGHMWWGADQDRVEYRVRRDAEILRADDPCCFLQAATTCWETERDLIRLLCLLDDPGRINALRERQRQQFPAGDDPWDLVRLVAGEVHWGMPFAHWVHAYSAALCRSDGGASCA